MQIVFGLCLHDWNAPSVRTIISAELAGVFAGLGSKRPELAVADPDREAGGGSERWAGFFAASRSEVARKSANASGCVSPGQPEGLSDSMTAP